MDYLEALEELRTAYAEWDGSSEETNNLLHAVEDLLDAAND